MNKPELKDYLAKAFPYATIDETIDFVVIRVSSGEILNTAQELKQSEHTQFDFLFCQTAVDLQPELELVYHLRSTKFQHEVEIKVTISDRENASIDSVTSIWKAAEMFECEIFDLFGIKFNGHPDLRRLFMPQDWLGYPLRKDYLDENIITR